MINTGRAPEGPEMEDSPRRVSAPSEEPDGVVGPNWGEPVTTDHLATMIRDNVQRLASRPAMRYQDGAGWRPVSYTELGEKIRSTANALVESGVQPGDMVGIFSPNRPEWTIADFAILSAGAVSVPIYATNTAKQAEYIVADADLSVIFVGDQAQYDKVVAFRSRTPGLKRIVVFDEKATLAGEDCRTFADFLATGAASSRDEEVDARIAAGSPDDLATLIYTSGTTGDPKGAVLTHANFFHQVRALDDRFDIGPGDTSLCFLPLSHAYERVWSIYVFAKGAENCYVLDPSRVVQAMAEVRPSTMVSIPRLYEKIYATVLDRVERGSAPRAKLFGWSIGVGGRYQRRRTAGESINPLLRVEHAVADRLVLAKVRDVVGGEKKVFAAGGAPLSKDIEEFFFATGILICQGYGLTETAALVTCNYPGGFKFGTVGKPVLGTDLRIAADGEIQVRGGNIMSGYYGRPDDTAAAFEDGWFKTGDQGMVDADGFVVITDRLKDIIITSQGKNIAPQHVESALGSDPYIEQLIVIGDRRAYLSALIEPDFAMLERYADEHGIPQTSRADLVVQPQIRALFDSRIAELSRELANYERVKRYTLVPREFTRENGELTPTLKLKRRVIEQEYADVIEAMYGATRQAPAAR